MFSKELLVRALTFSCSLRSCFMTQFSLGRRDSMVITSSPSPLESELVSYSFVTPFLGATFSHSELESVASSHVPFLGSFFFFLASFGHEAHVLWRKRAFTFDG